MAAEDAVVIKVRTDGEEQAEAKVKSLDRTVRGLGSGARIAGTGLKNLSNNMNLGSTAAYAVQRATFAAGASVLGLGALAARSGLQFNASMEQNEIAFTQFLGSAQAARKELSWLTTEAASTPFQLPQITQGARQLLAFNLGLKGTNAWLETISDVAAGAGLGADAIDRIVTAVGQIKSKGRLQGDELLQLQELGVLDSKKLAKGLGLTPLQLTSGNANISSDKALRAIKAQLDDTFGGQAQKQAQSFNGQLSNIQDNLDKTLGTITKPGFEYLRNKVLPSLGDATTEINKIFGRTDIDTGQKIQLSRQVLGRKLGPFADAIGDQIKAAHLPEKIGDEFGQAIPFIAARMADAAEPAASAFIHAWLHSGPWGQFLSAAWLAKKTGAFGAAGKALGGGKTGGVLDALGGRGTPTNPLYVVVIDGPMRGLGPGKSRTTRTAKALQKFGPFAGPIGVGVAGGAAVGLGIGDLLNIGPFGEAHAKKLTPAQLEAQRQRALNDAVRRGNITPREALQPSKPSATAQTAWLTPIIVKVGDKVIAQETARQVQDARARRGRG